MKILVCFKPVPNWEKVLDEDWEVFSPELDIKYAGSGFGCFDEAALEIALRLKNQAQEDGGSAIVTAVTVGDAPSAALTEMLYAAGFDEVVVLKCEDDGFAPAHSAAELAKFALRLSPDLILAGLYSGAADASLVPLMLAENLCVQAVQDVLDVSLAPGGIQTEQSDEDGLWQRAYALPALVTVGNSPAVLRAVNLRARLNARGRAATVIPCHDAPADALVFSRPKSDRALTMLDFADENELARRLLRELSAPGVEEAAQSAAITPPGDIYTVTCEVEISFERLSAIMGMVIPDLILLKDIPCGRALAVKLANKTGAGVQSGVNAARFEKNGVYVKKRVCAGNLDREQFFPYPVILTTSQPLPKSAISIEKQGSTSSPAKHTAVPAIDFPPQTTPPPLWEKKLAEPVTNTLIKANCAILCGVGSGGPESCDRARLLAQKLGVGFGLTRPAALGVQGGAEALVGISGSVIAPATVLVLGASGAGAFMTGIEGAGKICAVNTDPRAMIFRAADIGAIADAPAVIEAMLAQCGEG